MKKSSLTSVALLLLAHFAAGKKCEHPSFRQQSFEMRTWSDVDDSTLPPEYTCPRENDPKTHTECCLGGGCCSRAPLYQEDKSMMVIAIAVMSLCAILTATVILCCFWSRCPCYNTCKANYTTSDVIVYSLAKEDDPLSLMPVEEGRSHRYTPCTVKMKKVEEV